jgi:2',3'-cyclic-nucleotide 2'-phosphodiesterase (5'-nucleotidase family)
MKIFNRFLLFSLFFIVSCKTHYVATSNDKQLYKVTSNNQTDTLSDIESYLKPFRDSLNITMNEVIGEAIGDFIKEKPSGSLGNLVVDAMLADDGCQMTDGRKVSVAITNPGGLRINQIPKGKITKGKIFELLPFENELVIMEVNGKVLKQWMGLIKDNGGWPMTKQMPIRFYDNKLLTESSDTTQVENPETGEIKLVVKLNRFKEDSTYYIATNDYVANGGDNCSFLIPCKKYPTGKTIRELVIAFIKKSKIIIPNKTTSFPQIGE